MTSEALIQYLGENTGIEPDAVFNLLAMLGQTIEACFRNGEPVDVPGLGEFALAIGCEIEFNADEYIVRAAKEQ